MQGYDGYCKGAMRGDDECGNTMQGYDGYCKGAMHRASTICPQSKNIASVMRGFKSAVTIRARNIDGGFAWQSNYYDHIIRTNTELTRIRNYIKNNPGKWNM